jgi:phage N-6-adenine-methyltransferase
MECARPSVRRGAAGGGPAEWHTPAQYIELARAVLGEIDLDPASNEEAQKTVRARRYFTAADNGLNWPWYGRVWLNSPYGQPHITQFVDKMIAEREAERMSAGIMLTHNNTDTAWFHRALARADAICFTRGRIKFVRRDGRQGCSPTQGQTFFYFGHDVANFRLLFAQAGFIVRLGAAWGNEIEQAAFGDGWMARART